MIAALFLCIVVSVYDGDSVTCADGSRVRMAAINAREMTGNPCPRDYPCVPMSAPKARDTLAAMVLGREIECLDVDRSHNRLVGDCTVDGRNIGCAMIAAGAAADWARYRVEYKLRRCEG
jgi:endonuclease YncB( thermonuclease family)